MAVEVLLQHFVQGADGRAGRERALAVLAPFLPEGIDRHGRGHVVTADGGAEVFGLGERTSTGAAVFGDLQGDDVWDLLLEVARVTGWTILPLGQAPLVVPGQRVEDLPDELRTTAVRLGDAEPARELRERLRGDATPPGVPRPRGPLG